MKRTGNVWCWGMFAVLVSCLPVVAAGAGTPNPAAGPEEAYVVKKGDTLWGISRDLMQDPLLWPRLWEQNPFIANPNLIYPGDRLALPGRDLVPAPVAESPAPEPAKPATSAEAPPVVSQESPQPAPPAPAPVAQKAPEPPPLPVLTRDAVACSPVMMAEGKAESVAVGRLLKGLDDRALISMEDEVIVSRDTQASLNPGDRLAVIRPAQRLVDQQTGQPISRALSVLGLVEVKEVRDRIAQGRISYSCGAMTMGDLVIPYVPAQFPEDKVAQPTRRSVEGVVLESSRGERLISQLQIVYLGVGATQGVASGDVFALYRISPPVANAGGAPFAMPPMRLGEAVIIRVADRTATAAVTTSNGGREIRIGDRAVLSRQIAP